MIEDSTTTAKDLDFEASKKTYQQLPYTFEALLPISLATPAGIDK